MDVTDTMRLIYGAIEIEGGEATVHEIVSWIRRVEKNEGVRKLPGLQITIALMRLKSGGWIDTRIGTPEDGVYDGYILYQTKRTLV